jgi:hypothetical protein
MFDVRRQKPKPVVVIRAATGNELSEYEKNKLANIEKNAQENKIETVSLIVNGDKQRIEPLNKEVNIELGSLAIKSNVAPGDISKDDLFVIKCELDDTILNQPD